MTCKAGVSPAAIIHCIAGILPAFREQTKNDICRQDAGSTQEQGYKAMEKKTGTFKLTACDWCVLVVVFSVLVSLINPALSQAVEEKKLTDMVDCLQTIRANIQLYKAAHDGLWPGQRYPGDAVTADGFTEALTGTQSQNRTPLMREMLNNPYAESHSITCVNDPDAKPAGTEGTAWWFNAATGEFYACDSEFHTNY